MGDRYVPDWDEWSDGPVKRWVAKVVDVKRDQVVFVRLVEPPGDAERVATDMAAAWNRRAEAAAQAVQSGRFEFGGLDDGQSVGRVPMRRGDRVVDGEIKREGE